MTEQEIKNLSDQHFDHSIELFSNYTNFQDSLRNLLTYYRKSTDYFNILFDSDYKITTATGIFLKSLYTHIYFLKYKLIEKNAINIENGDKFLKVLFEYVWKALIEEDRKYMLLCYKQFDLYLSNQGEQNFVPAYKRTYSYQSKCLNSINYFAKANNNEKFLLSEDFFVDEILFFDFYGDQTIQANIANSYIKHLAEVEKQNKIEVRYIILPIKAYGPKGIQIIKKTLEKLLPENKDVLEIDTDNGIPSDLIPELHKNPVAVFYDLCVTGSKLDKIYSLLKNNDISLASNFVLYKYEYVSEEKMEMSPELYDKTISIIDAEEFKSMQENSQIADFRENNFLIYEFSEEEINSYLIEEGELEHLKYMIHDDLIPTIKYLISRKKFNLKDQNDIKIIKAILDIKIDNKFVKKELLERIVNNTKEEFQIEFQDILSNLFGIVLGTFANSSNFGIPTAIKYTQLAKNFFNKRSIDKLKNKIA